MMLFLFVMFALGIFGTYLLFDTIVLDEIFILAPKYVETELTFLWFSADAITVLTMLLFIGAMGKSAQLGLHTWLPDAMEGPTPVSALIHAATMVTAGVFMIARLSPMMEYAPDTLTVVTLIGATTENPSFEVISALLSRCQVYILKEFEKTDLEALLNRAIEKDEILSQKNIKLKETNALLRLSGGDARKLLNIFELIINAEDSDKIIVTDKMVMDKESLIGSCSSMNFRSIHSNKASSS